MYNVGVLYIVLLYIRTLYAKIYVQLYVRMCIIPQHTQIKFNKPMQLPERDEDDIAELEGKIK